jgi:hypothetical protein
VLEDVEVGDVEADGASELQGPVSSMSVSGSTRTDPSASRSNMPPRSSSVFAVRQSGLSTT